MAEKKIFFDQSEKRTLFFIPLGGRASGAVPNGESRAFWGTFSAPTFGAFPELYGCRSRSSLGPFSSFSGFVLGRPKRGSWRPRGTASGPRYTAVRRPEQARNGGVGTPGLERVWVLGRSGRAPFWAPKMEPKLVQAHTAHQSCVRTLRPGPIYAEAAVAGRACLQARNPFLTNARNGLSLHLCKHRNPVQPLKGSKKCAPVPQEKYGTDEVVGVSLLHFGPSIGFWPPVFAQVKRQAMPSGGSKKGPCADHCNT